MFCKKSGIIFTLLIITLFIFQNNILAMSIEELKPIYTQETSSFDGFGKEVFGIIKNIAVISSVVVLAFIGLKFMFGSVDQKAEYKKSLLPLAIGIFVVLGATTITGMVWDMQGTSSGNCSHKVACNSVKKQCLSCGKLLAPGMYEEKHTYVVSSVKEEYVAANMGQGAWRIVTTYKCGVCGNEKTEKEWES